MFDLQLKLLCLVGLCREDSLKLNAIQLSCFCAVLFFITSQTLFALNHFGYVLTLAEASATLFSTLLTLIKFLTFCLRKERFYRLIDQIKEKSFDILEDEKIVKVESIEKIVTSVYLLTAGFTTFSYCIAPIVVSSKDFILHGTKFHPDLPYKTNFIYDISALPAFALTYVGLCLSSHTTISINVSSTTDSDDSKIVFSI